MSTTAKASLEYLKNAVTGASPEQLQVMLYDGAIRFALRGRDAIEKKNFEETFNNLDRAQRIVIEIGAGVNRDANPDVADRIVALSNYAFRRLVDANMQQSVAAVDDAVRILRHQRETWAIIAEKTAKARCDTTRDGAPDGAAAASTSICVHG